MRAYTSLTGHIFGSHNEIEGYYEMHKGYFSWKSLVHAKLLYYATHPVKKSARFLFDKILHNEHYIGVETLNRDNVYPIISIRSPEKTIPSIVSHFKKVNPSHEYTELNVATQYYIERVTQLAELAQKISGQYYYFDAEAITSEADSLLSAISQHLNLSSVLSTEYQQMEQTGKRFSGDNSQELFSGKIQQTTKKTDNKLLLPDELLAQALTAYNNARKTIIQHASSAYTVEGNL